MKPSENLNTVFLDSGFLTRPDTNSHRQGPTADSDKSPLLAKAPHVKYQLLSANGGSIFLHLKMIIQKLFIQSNRK
jgi:hypothetical protein